MSEPANRVELTSVVDEIETYAVELCESAEAEGISLRLFGSCAIRIKCAQQSDILDRCNRHPKDIDCVIRHADRNRLRTMLLASGWQEKVELTAQTDGSRLEFRLLEPNVVLDVSVDVLRFAQTLDVRKRIELERPTLPAADLLLTKLQIPELTRSDFIDMIALIYAVPLGDADDRGINLHRIVDVTSRSWRWYKSVTVSLLAMDRELSASLCDLSESDRGVTRSRLRLIEKRILGARKTWWWKARSLIGEVLPWHDRVETNSEA